MRAARRFLEIGAALAGALLSFLPFAGNLLRSLFRSRAERRRVEEALANWDGRPGPAPEEGTGGAPSLAGGGSVFVLAGEPSGDRLASGVVEALLRRRPGTRVRGYGGARMEAAGARLDFDLAGDAVMGVSAVLRAAPRFVGLYSRYLRILDEERPDAVLLVDYPGFNLRAGRAARRRGIPVVWFVVPQIWAWAPWRARRVGRAADRLLVILPFERAFYARHGVEAHFVGYPLIEDRDREATDPVVEARLREGNRPVLAILPGSRRHVVEENLPGLLRAAGILRERLPEVRPVVACASPRLRRTVDRIVARTPFHVEVLDGHARTLLAVARAAATVSGTITMECVHAGVPAVTVYRVSPAGRMLLPLVLTTPGFAMANLLAGRPVFPEHTDPDGEARAVAAELLVRMRDGPEREAIVRHLHLLRERLRVEGTADRVAAAIERYL